MAGRKTLTSLTEYGSAHVGEEEVSTSVAPAASTTSMSMKASREEMKVKRAGTKHTLHFVGLVMASTRRQKMCNGITVLTRPVRIYAGEDMQQTSEKDGNKDFLIDQSKETWKKVLLEMTNCLHEPSKLREIGFAMVAFAEYHIEEDLDIAAVDNEVYDKAFRFVNALMRRLLPHFLTYSRAPPRIFAGFLDERRSNHTPNKHDFHFIKKRKAFIFKYVGCFCFIVPLVIATPAGTVLDCSTAVHEHSKQLKNGNASALEARLVYFFMVELFVVLFFCCFASRLRTTVHWIVRHCTALYGTATRLQHREVIIKCRAMRCGAVFMCSVFVLCFCCLCSWAFTLWCSDVAFDRWSLVLGHRYLMFGLRI